MICPYSDLNCTPGARSSKRCNCGRFLKRCVACATASRAFASFCRACGTALPPTTTNWPAYRGGPRRLGLNPAAFGSDHFAGEIILKLHLGSECRSLLGYDGHLLAVAQDGVIELADAASAKSIGRFQTAGPITAQPCIHNGLLLLATRGHATAYSLAAMALQPPRLRPLWQVPLNGTPIHALTAVGDRLYITMASPDWREVHVIDDIGAAQPQPARPIHGAPKVSWLAAEPEQSRALFLSGTDGEGIRLHLLGPDLTTHSVSLQSFAEHPVASISGTVFGIFGEGHGLHRIQASTGAVEEALEKDIHLFALADDGADEWNRDGVMIDSDGVSFCRSGVRDSFQPYERAVKGSPVIAGDCAALIGMEDGNVRIYYLSQLPRHDVWRVGDGGGAPITALVSFDSYIAAGNREGVVELRELRRTGVTR